MSNKLIDLAGHRIGRLTVIERAENSKYGMPRWKVVCDCGTTKIVLGSNLSPAGKTRSCGCLWKETMTTTSAGNKYALKHGHGKGSPTYGSWFAMKQRCLNPNSIRYPKYGGRGITVCERWQGKDGFINFMADMGARPEGRTLDRIDVNGNYETSNCKWSTMSEQNLNRRPFKRTKLKSTIHLEVAALAPVTVQPLASVSL